MRKIFPPFCQICGYGRLIAHGVNMRFILLVLFLLPASVLLAQENPDIICRVDISSQQTGEKLYQQTFNVYEGQFWVRYQDALVEIPELGTVRVALAADGGDGRGKYFFAQMFLFRTSDNQQISKLYLKNVGGRLSQNFFADYVSTIGCDFL
jgi:hypothetical protein